MIENKTLPEAFLHHTEYILGPERFARFLAAMDEEATVSIRLNPAKTSADTMPARAADVGAGPVPARATDVGAGPVPARCSMPTGDSEPVPWSPNGFYLPRRPAFTFDPLLHAGCYYVQEAASQFIVHCLRCLRAGTGPAPTPAGDTERAGTGSAPTPAEEQGTGAGLTELKLCLDLCAAPGGKSTALRTELPADSLLVSNEPVRQRAQVLSENMQKWGYAGSIVTNNYPRDFARSGFRDMFDLVVCDVPCSGEGMFRKDPAAIGEWSEQGVERCQRLQREIIADIWPCLRNGGIMLYSTCTFNTRENEENVLWFKEQLGASIVAIPTSRAWGITGSLLPALSAPVYRFIPGLTRSEGLFVAVLRKGTADVGAGPVPARAVDVGTGLVAACKEHKKRQSKFSSALSRLNLLECSAAEPLSVALDRRKYPIVDLTYPTAIAYLRREAITLPADTPRGQVIVSFRGHPLGFAKNIGSRANNLYPREWAIRTTHVPTDYDPILPFAPE